MCKKGVWSDLGVDQDQRLGLLDRVACGVLREAQAQLGQVGSKVFGVGGGGGGLECKRQVPVGVYAVGCDVQYGVLLVVVVLCVSASARRTREPAFARL